MSCCCVSQIMKSPLPFLYLTHATTPCPGSTPSMSSTIRTAYVASGLSVGRPVHTTLYCQGSGAVSYSAIVYCACCLPFSCPSRPQCQHKSRFSLSHPPHHSTPSLGISLTGPNAVRELPLSHISLSFLDWATQLPKGAPASPSTRPRYSIGLPSPVPSSLRRATADHRSRWQSRTRSISSVRVVRTCLTTVNQRSL